MEQLIGDIKKLFKRKEQKPPKKEEFGLPKLGEASIIRSKTDQSPVLSIQQDHQNLLIINPTAAPEGKHNCLKIPLSNQEELELNSAHPHAVLLGFDKLPPGASLTIACRPDNKMFVKAIGFESLPLSLSHPTKDDHVDSHYLTYLTTKSSTPASPEVTPKPTEALSSPEDATQFHVLRYDPVTQTKESVAQPVSPPFRESVLEYRKSLPSAEVITSAFPFHKLPKPDGKGNINFLGETITVDDVRNSLNGVGGWNRFSLDRFDQKTGIQHKVYYLPVPATRTGGNIVLVPLTLEGYGQTRDEVLKPKLIAGERLFVPQGFSKEQKPHRIDGTVKDVFLEESHGKVVLKNKQGQEETYLISICTTEGTRYLNEDAVDVFVFKLPDGTECLSLSVKDGMGGHSAGEKASEIASKAGQAYLESLTKNNIEWTKLQQRAQTLQQQSSQHTPQQALGCTLMGQVIKVENNAVYTYNKDQGVDSGATRTGVIIIEGQVYAGNVGDARTNFISPEGRHQITTVDHSLVERLIVSGQITREESVNHPQGNIIYRVLGDKPIVEVEVEGVDQGTSSIFSQSLSIGSTIAITCDGIPDGLKEINPGEKVAQVIKESTDIRSAARDLVVKASPLSRDNDTAVVVKRVR